jgi:colanic acid biosynthesis glycosyl transferase WcaI
LRVLIVSQYFWPETFVINDAAVGLRERGHEVTVLTGLPNYPHGRFFKRYGLRGPFAESYGGVDVVRVPHFPRGRGGRMSLSLNYLSFAVLAGVIGPLRCRGRYDLVFVYQPSPVTVGLPAIVLKKQKRLPIMFWVQDLWPESLSATGVVRSRRVLDWVARMVRYIYGRCDRVLVQSERFIPRVRALGVEPEKVSYFPNWAEAVYRPVVQGKGAPERGEVAEGFRILFGGSVGAAQDFETILTAAEKLRGYPEIRWVVLGDGRMRPWVEERVKRLGLEKTVSLLGKQPVGSMPHYFALADALLVTLKKAPTFSLTIPAKVQTYLACGKPILAALDGEGARVIQESGAGLAVPAQDADALAEAALAMYQTPPERRAEMGRCGRAYYEEHFEREKLLDRLEGWMLELTEGRR